MKLIKKDSKTKSIHLKNVSDDDREVLAAVDFLPFEEENFLDKDGEIVEIWRHSSNFYADRLGKWVAFKQEGIPFTLHGKIVSVSGTCFVVKCKNGSKRYPMIHEIYKLFDTKEECYQFKSRKK